MKWALIVLVCLGLLVMQGARLFSAGTEIHGLEDVEAAESVKQPSVAEKAVEAPSASPVAQMNARFAARAAKADGRAASVPDSSEPLFDDAYQLLSAGRVDEAEGKLQDVLRENPKSDEALLELGMLYAHVKKQPEKAIPFFREALEKNPENPDALDQLLVATTKARSLAESAKTLRDLASLYPDSPGLNGEMGRMLIDQGRAGEAVSYFERAARSDPSSRVQLDLAHALSTSAQTDEARRVLQKVLTSDPQNEEAADLLSRLRG